MDYKNVSGVSRIPLSEQVYRNLVDSIANGSIPPGTELKEQHLAKQMNVSATPVREAIRRLASDGWWISSPITARWCGPWTSRRSPTLRLPGGSGAFGRGRVHSKSG